MAGSFGFSTNPASKVKPLSNTPIDPHRQWNRAGEVGYFDNASRAFQTQGDWTQERSLSGASRAKSRTGGTSSIRSGTLPVSAPAGGYVNMGSSGPAPLVQKLQPPELRPSLLPNAMAKGVPGRFTNDPAHDFRVSGVAGRVFARGMQNLVASGLKDKPNKPEAEQPEADQPEADQPNDRPRIPLNPKGGPAAITGGPYPQLGAGEGAIQGEIVDELPPHISGALPQGFLDVDSWEVAGEIGTGNTTVGRNPGVNRQAQRAIGPGMRAIGPGDPDAGPNPVLGPPEGFAIGTNNPNPLDRFGRTQTRGGRGAIGARSDIIEVDSRPLDKRGPTRPKDSTIPFFRVGEPEVDLAEAMRMSAAGFEWPYAQGTNTR